MLTEIKLYILTRVLITIFRGDQEQAFEHLKELVNYDNPAFWDQWYERYELIHTDKNLKILMLHELGWVYRKIQRISNASPNYISKIIKQYDIEDYDTLPGITMVTERVELVYNSLEREGVTL